MSDKPASQPIEITIDVNASTGPREARAWNHTTRQWFDFATMTFSDTPTQPSAPYVPVPGNPFMRSSPFVKLEPGTYKLYAFPVGVEDWDAVADQDIHAAPVSEGRVMNISISQPK